MSWSTFIMPLLMATESSDEASFDVGLSWRQSRGSVEPRPCSHPPGEDVGEVTH